MNTSEPFTAAPSTSLLMMALAVAGIAAFPLLPVAPLPQNDFPTVKVAAQLPEEASKPWRQPWRTTRAPVRANLRSHGHDVDEHARATSIVLQFDLDRNLDAATRTVSFPPIFPRQPAYRKVNPADLLILVIAAYSDTLPIATVDDFADTSPLSRFRRSKGWR
ncbi:MULTISPECIES: hypothetical protein [Bradyrhizobium]|uniref:hypothetical protein n=1 Tax=Bradyrhizobium TaxID=374 RepID=UPI000943F1ED|nr:MULTISPECIES: hypothetical protein [Bradyrhizobium]